MSGYQRVLLKLSGEALMGDDAYGINRSTIEGMVRDIAEVVHSGVQLGIVIGGGNIFRGVAGGAVGMVFLGCFLVGSSRVDLQACKLEYSIVSPK